jgi:hypothetical protein
MQILQGSDDTHNYWIFGLCPSSGILSTREHNVPETGAAFVPRGGRGEIPTVIFSFRAPDDGQSLKPSNYEIRYYKTANKLRGLSR